jgi:hypothetical protein
MFTPDQKNEISLAIGVGMQSSLDHFVIHIKTGPGTILQWIFNRESGRLNDHRPWHFHPWTRLTEEVHIAPVVGNSITAMEVKRKMLQ